MDALVPVQSAGQRLPVRLVSASLHRCIGSVSIRRSVSGFAMDTRISSRAPSQFTIRSQQVPHRLLPPLWLKFIASSVSFDSMKKNPLTKSDLKESLGVASSSDLRIKEWEVDMYQNELAISQGIRIRRKPPSKAPLGYTGPFELRLLNGQVADSPSNILEEITWFKDQEVSRMKELNPLEALKKAVENAPPTRDFVGALRTAHQRTGFPGLIAEVKKASPSRGILKENFDPVEIAQAYERGGAACLSVLTDQKYFKGGFENLEAIRSAGVKCPLLCKEFVVDPWQIYYARAKGADAVLLIAAILTDLEITYLLKLSKKLGLAALVEVHDEREMGRALGIEGIELVGINNRSLETFKVDISNTKKLLEGEHGRQIREKDMIVVGESCLFTPDDIAYVQDAGVKAVLVGESIVKQNDPEKGIAGLFGKNISQT
ncbi:indole-3-glycerol phosphate synthase, chloroplastic-like isoform X1 [Brassica napus]|uniref:indole-3-glycerol phosphate synthase, chloroplastic-like isoform X1 n=1 Tax=Brassica napus TaxID=3708 RepID=UPI000BBF230D|nr:indole-3-glycerol phosphate synthase, chloroplastic-like isoform X1 [Brassica napus]